MKIFNKTIKEYIAAIWVFFVLAFIMMVIVTALRLNNYYPPETQNLVTLLGVAIIIWAGASAVKDHGFNLLQTAFVGFLISLAAAWSLPIFHPLIEAFYVFLINGVIYALVAAASGWVTKRAFTKRPNA